LFLAKLTNWAIGRLGDWAIGRWVDVDLGFGIWDLGFGIWFLENWAFLGKMKKFCWGAGIFF
jgi:hypothetical protein